MHAGWLAGWVSVCVCFLLGLQTFESLWRDTTASLSLIVAINSARNKKSGGTLHTISDLRNSTSSAPKWNALVPPFFPPRHCRDLCVSLPARADYLVGGGGGAEEGELAFTQTVYLQQTLPTLGLLFLFDTKVACNNVYSMKVFNKI
jgi:hypothetical protein